MKKIFLIALIALTSVMGGTAQTKATTEDGKKVVLNEDGTWKYESATTDTPTTGYECSDLVFTETDKMTGTSSTSAKETLIISEDGGKSGFGITLLNGSNSLIVSIQAVGAGSCINDDSKMNILFRDGTRLEFVNNGKFNCDAKFTLYLGGSFGKKSQLNLLKTKEIETMRIWTTKSYVEKDFSKDQSVKLKSIISCLTSN
jgi:hypothetical protein